MTTMNSDTAILVLLVLVGREVISWLVTKFLTKTVGTNYVDTSMHSVCIRERETELNDLKKEVRENFGIIKGVLLVMATGKEVDEALLMKLVK